MKQKLLAFMISLALALPLAGCGHREETETPVPEPQNTAEEQNSSEDEGQNPVMNFVGVYSTDDSAEALVEAEGMENARITVTYAPSPWFHDRTVMSGRFDPETRTVEFIDAAMTEYTYNSDGSVNEEKVCDTNGRGRAVFDPEKNTLTIASGENETVYTWGPSPDMKTVTDPEHYASVTAMDKAKVETVVAYAVRAAYLGENWFALADRIAYPITINGTKLDDSVAFIEYMQDKTVAESDRLAMADEDFLDMFVNGQGICMGSGQIWLNDPNYMTDKEPELQIIAISGIIPSSADSEPQTDPVRQDGERFDTVIMLEGMEETVGYEHVRNETVGFEMDYEYEMLDRHSQPDGERFVCVWDDPGDSQNYLEVKYSPQDAETVAASISEALSGEYEIVREAYTLARAGRCIRIDASEEKGGGTMADILQTVYIIPASDGCRVATAHYFIEDAEGLGRRFGYLINTLAVIDRQGGNG